MEDSRSNPQAAPRDASIGTCALAEPVLGSYFISTYPPFSCWSPTALEAVERVLATPSDVSRPLGLYLHLPFCEKRCDYCYYLSYDDRAVDLDRYLDAAVHELTLYAGRPAIAERPIGFVYFGGGTPSLLSVAHIRRLLGDLQAIMPWRGVREVSFECAPKSVSEEKLVALRDAGVTRISLGVQELDDRVLALNRRVHLVRDVERAWQATERVGFAVRNIDLIAGLPGQTEASFAASLERVLEMRPESVTLYQLEIPLSTPLYRSLQAAALRAEPADWEGKRERVRRGFARLEEAGYTVRSGYTAVRDAVAHRFVYQDEQYRGADLLGLGVSSFSYLAGVHQQNLADLDDYLGAVARSRLPMWRAHELSPEERLVREFVLQLKLGGASGDFFRERFGVEILERFAIPLAELAARGWLELADDSVRMTRDGLLRVDRLLPRFYLPQHRDIRYS